MVVVGLHECLHPQQHEGSVWIGASERERVGNRENTREHHTLEDVGTGKCVLKES